MRNTGSWIHGRSQQVAGCVLGDRVRVYEMMENLWTLGEGHGWIGRGSTSLTRKPSGQRAGISSVCPGEEGCLKTKRGRLLATECCE